MSAPVRPLDGDEFEAFRLGRLVAAENAPYFMHALFAVAPVAAPGLGTFAVDGTWRLYMDPDLLTGPNRWDSTTVGAVLLHEAGHLLRDHAGRAGNLPTPRNHLAWNLAGDAEINDDLLSAGVPLPEGVVTPSALGCQDGDLAETYYAHLVPPDGNAPDLPDDGSPGCGSGSGSPAAPGELPANVALDDDAGTPLTPAEGDLVRRRVAQAVQDVQHAKGRGSVPAGLTRWAADVLAPPTVAWDRLLRAAVRRAVADRAGRTDYTYARPSRRTVPGIIKPAMRAPSVIVSIVVDTSGSMGQTDLDAAMSEVTGVLRSSGVAREHLRLLSCDAATGTAQRVRSATSVRLTGGGGTDMRVGITAAEDATPAPHVVIVLTDGDTPWPEHPTRANLVCAVIRPTPPIGTPPWATTVHIDPAA
ncbi:VWA-like domain-containing protein [Isoptericola sp. NPDC056605]|uniref:vWA domain-containing protein n=1 Tax=Isoptericola sp. NPDC056605 TaxID=3345876 RepID=UPI0036AEC7CA